MKLRYTLPALADLGTILDYIAAQSPQDARRVHARIKIVTDLLLLHPYIGRRTSDPAIRRITATPHPYLIFYEITGKRRSSFTRSGMRLAIPRRCQDRPEDAGFFSD